MSTSQSSFTDNRSNSSRGRNSSNPRGRGRRTEQNNARSLMNADAKPVTLEKFFATVINLQRANVKTDFDPTCADRIAAPVYELTVSSQIILGLTNLNGHQIDGLYLPTGIRIGIHLGCAFKMISSTPESSFITVNPMLPLTHNELELPEHILQSIDLIGKSSALNDQFILRYRNNLLSIKRLFAHALVISRNLPDANMIATYTNAEAGGLNGYLADANYRINRLVFEDEESVKWIRSRALADFKLLYDQGYTDGQGRVIGWPPLDLSRIPSRQIILAWFGNLLPHYYPNPPANFLPLSALMMIEEHWLTQSANTFQQIDNVFANSPIAQTTLNQVLVHWHIYNFRDYFTNDRLVSLTGNLAIFYQNQIANRLRSFLKMGSLGKTKFGNMSQIITVNQDQMVYTDNPFPHYQVNSQLNQASGVLHLDNNSSSVISSITRLTTNTTFEPSYNYIMHNTLKNILSNFVNNDRIIR